MSRFDNLDVDDFVRSFEEEVGPERGGDPYASEPPAAALSETLFYDPWSDPKPPRFLRGILPSGIEATVFELALRDGIDPGAQALALLTAASGVAYKGSRFTPYVNSDWSVPPIIWTMLIADSGQKKTVVGDNVFRTIRELDADAWREHGKRIKSWRSLPKTQQKETPEPEEPHTFLVEDVTVEKLQMILAATSRGTLLMKDEIAGFSASADTAKRARPQSERFTFRHTRVRPTTRDVSAGAACSSRRTV